jgi:hypothetical protein
MFVGQRSQDGEDGKEIFYLPPGGILTAVVAGQIRLVICRDRRPGPYGGEGKR